MTLPTFSCPRCRDPWPFMVAALDDDADRRALDGWTCPTCADDADTDGICCDDDNPWTLLRQGWALTVRALVARARGWVG